MKLTGNISIFDLLIASEKKSQVEVLYEELKSKSLKQRKWWHEDYVYNQKYICSVCGKITKQNKTMKIEGPTNYEWQDKDKIYYSYSSWHEEGGHDGTYSEEEIIKTLTKLKNDYILIGDCGKSHFTNYWRKGQKNMDKWTNNVGIYLRKRLEANNETTKY